MKKTKSLDKQIDKYIKDVGSLILCDKKYKKDFIDSFREDLIRYYEMTEVDDVEQIIEHFGTPEHIALYYYDQNDLVKLAKHVSTRKKIVISAIVFAILVLLVWAIAVTIMLVKSNDYISGNYINEFKMIKDAVIHIINLF